jgi:hypothetical protein
MRNKLFRRDESVYAEASIFDAWLSNADERDRFSKSLRKNSTCGQQNHLYLL